MVEGWCKRWCTCINADIEESQSYLKSISDACMVKCLQRQILYNRYYNYKHRITPCAKLYANTLNSFKNLSDELLL